jgi:outer membrane protein assembly factor BamB
MLALGAVASGCPARPKLSIHYDVPLAPTSPWPKFRRDSIQDGLSPVTPSYDGSKPWSYTTGRGVFSSPVVAGDGTVYVGSGDRYFYAFDPTGKVLWQKLTGEIIDSSALLDNKGSVYVGSGDGKVYAWNAVTGDQQWTFLADDPSTIKTGFSYIRWFEGNVGIDAAGHLIAPNDNNVLYALDPATGTKVWAYTQSDVSWSLPAIDVPTGNMFFGNNSVLGAILGAGTNVYSLDGKGNQLWNGTTLGTNAASPVLTSDGAMIMGSFDGYVYAYEQESGNLRWSFATRDHIYASPALLPDGTIIQPSADGTIYALDSKTGKQKWAFDTLSPVRSSPAVDGDGNIYLGTGNGQLLVLTKNGQRRWAITLVDNDRNDLNASPALGLHGIYLGGANGGVFGVPYDYCLSGTGKSDSRCEGGGGEDLPSDGAFLYYTSSLGAPTAAPPSSIDANDSLAFSLYVRKASDTQLALIDSANVNVTVTPPSPFTFTVSGDRHFLTVVPQTAFTPDANGQVTFDISGQYLENLSRHGLVFTGGSDAGSFTGHYQFTLAADRPGAIPVPIPQQMRDPAGILEMYRLAAPLPTILPSYNEIGFDSLHYLIGFVEGSEQHAIAWVVGGTLAADQNTTIFDPTTKSVFPLEVTYTNGRFTFLNQASFSLEALNAVISFDSFRLNARVDATGTSLVPPHLVVSTNCSHIPTFGNFLESIGFCSPAPADELVAYGTVLLRPFNGGTQPAPPGVGEVSFAVSGQTLTATISGSTLPLNAHVFSLGLIDETSGHPVGLNYGLATTATADPSGLVQTVALTLDPTLVPANARVYLLVDAYPVARADMAFPQ